MLKVKTNRDLLNNDKNDDEKKIVYESKENEQSFEFVLPNINDLMKSGEDEEKE